MYYDTVEILADRNGNWKVFHSEIPKDRTSKKEYLPNSLGFFHYPREWGIEKGFETLRAHLVKRHEDEIAALTKSLAGLKNLKTP